MNNYDLVTGVDQKNWNHLSKIIYSGLYPKIFKDEIEVGQYNIKAIQFDIDKSPEWRLKPSKLVAEFYEKGLMEAGTYKMFQSRFDEFTKATFEIDLPSVMLKVIYENSNETEFISSILLGGEAYVINEKLRYRLLMGKINIPDDPHFTEILNEVFLPMLVDYLNEKVFTDLEIPDLDFEEIQLTTPEVLTQPDYLLGFSSIKPASVIPPSEGPWPENKGFIGFSANLLNALTNVQLKNLELKDSKTFEVKCFGKLIITSKFKFKNAKFKLIPDSKSQLSGKIEIDGTMDIIAQSFNKKEKGRVTTTINASPNFDGHIKMEGQKVNFVIDKFNEIDFKIDVSIIPIFIMLPLSFVLKLIINWLSGIVTRFIRGRKLELWELDTIEQIIGDLTFLIDLKEIEFNTVNAPGVDALFLIKGQANVSIAENWPVSISWNET